MTDEELGRKWASKRGKAPLDIQGLGGEILDPEKRYRWYDAVVPSRPDCLPKSVFAHIGFPRYPSEPAAYAALGAAVRKAREELGDPADDANVPACGPCHRIDCPLR